MVQLGHSNNGGKMAVAVPIKEMKNTSDFADLVDAEDEVLVTKNGYSKFYCISQKQREKLLLDLAQAKLDARIALAEKEIATGKYEDFETFEKSIKAEYDL